jgi:hypothetical protein
MSSSRIDVWNWHQIEQAYTEFVYGVGVEEGHEKKFLVLGTYYNCDKPRLNLFYSISDHANVILLQSADVSPDLPRAIQ